MIETIKDDLWKRAQEEGEAAARYRQRKTGAESAGDAKTARLYEHIAGEEDRHQQEFIERKYALEYSSSEEAKMTKPRTEIERQARHEQTYGKDSKPPVERRGLGQRTNDLLPMPPDIGPPLPRRFGLKWPWGKNGR